MSKPCLHVVDSESGEAPAQVRPGILGRSERRLSPQRRKNREDAAARFDRVVAQEQAHGRWSNSQIAERLRCDESYVRMLRRGESPLNLEHFEGLGTLRIAYLRAALEEAETSMPQAAQDAERLALKAGKIVGELQDSVLRSTDPMSPGGAEQTAEERLSICGHLSELDNLVHQTRRTIGGSR